MDDSIETLLTDVIDELSEKVKKYPGDNTYSLILKQIEFVRDCIEKGKNIFVELKGRELNFNVVASKNLSGPEEALQKKISEIAVYLSTL